MSENLRLGGVRLGWGRHAWRGRQLITRVLLLSVVGVVLASCSAIKLGYENLPRLVQWQADRYLSLDDSQASLVNRNAATLQRWHRQNLLPVYAQFLHGVEEELRSPVAADQVGAWRRTVVASGWRPIAQQAAPAVAALAVTLRPEQLTHLRETLAKVNAKVAKEFRAADPARRQEARYRRWVERAEILMGDTSTGQKRLIRESVAAMVGGEDAWWRTRLARQEALVALLEELSTEKPEPAAATRRVRTLLTGLFDDEARTAATPADELTAGLLALATPAQRQRALSQLDGYRQDFRLLASR